MDPSMKKRKADENGTVVDVSTICKITPEDARKIIEPFTQEQLIDILQHAVVRHSDVLDAVRSIADRDPVQRKLFIRGLGWDTTTDGLISLFSSYGDLAEAVVILDKVSGRSKGYGFVTFKHIDGALLALKEPSKKIDGRMTVTQLAASGMSGPAVNVPAADASTRKIYVGNVPIDMPADRLLAHFSSYGEIEEGPLGFDKQTGKSRGYALFVYKTTEAASASLVDPLKTIDGIQMVCKLAIDGKKGGKPGAPVAVGTGGIQGVTSTGPDMVGSDGAGVPPASSMPVSLSSQYGGPVSLSSFGGLGGFGTGHHGGSGLVHHGGSGLVHHGGSGLAHHGGSGLAHHGGSGLAHHGLNSTLPSSIGGPGLSSVGTQLPSLGGAPAGLGGPYSSSLQYGGPATGGFGGIGGGSLYRLPPSSVGMTSGGYLEGGTGNYGLSSSAYPGPLHQHSALSHVPRGVVPSGGMYPNLPPYY